MFAAGQQGITRQQADEILAELKVINELLGKGVPAAAAAPKLASLNGGEGFSQHHGR